VAYSTLDERADALFQLIDIVRRTFDELPDRVIATFAEPLWLVRAAADSFQSLLPHLPEALAREFRLRGSASVLRECFARTPSPLAPEDEGRVASLVQWTK
jgi:hypothetical protein